MNNYFMWHNNSPADPVVGDEYEGGIVAYMLQPGDGGYESGKIKGIICAATDQSNSITWGTTANNVSTSTDYFTSETNTSNIIAVNGAGSYAAKLCSDLVLNGYSDWVLPSYNEMEKICENQDLIGSFSVFPATNYWTSSQSTYDTSQAFVFNFYGSEAADANKLASYQLHVRAVRYFTIIK